jgi:multidrug resistance efflux pump
MTTSRWKLVPWILGIGCLAVTLFGAKNLFQPVSPPVQPVVPQAKANTGTLGPVVTGVVAPEVEVGEYVAPDVLPLAKVKKVLVKPGQTVKAGEALIEFDDSVPRSKWLTAKASLDVAKAKLAQAENSLTLFPLKLQSQETAVRKAELDHKNAVSLLDTANRLVENKFKINHPLTGKPWTEAEKAQLLTDDSDLFLARSRVSSLQLVVDTEKINLANLKALKPELTVAEAQSEVARIQTLADEANLIVESCILKSGVDGIVERITVGPGTVVVPQSPKPSVIVIPTGRRLVRAEVVPEFAHKLAGSEGRKVVIIDNDNFNLTYEGTVERIGEAFLTRRFASQDLVALNANRVLECTIHVTDPTPVGKPPLRVGQQVRVSFP